MKLIIASRNPHKLREIGEILAPLHILVEPAPTSLPEIIEDGETFRDNAAKKALEISCVVQHPVLADDSGLEVDELNGLPGVRSARFAGEKSSDPGNIAKLLDHLKGTPRDRRRARFRCVIAIAREGRLLGIFEGCCRGTILSEPRGKRGFGYDPVFYYHPLRKTFAEVPPEMKNSVSHRRRALNKAYLFLKKWSAPPTLAS